MNRQSPPNEPAQDVEPGRQIAMLQIVLASMVIGALTFALIAAAIRLLGAFEQNGVPRELTWLFAALTVIELVTLAVVRRLPVQVARRAIAASPGEIESNRQRLYRAYTSQAIISAAMLEGMAFLWVIDLLLLGHWASLLMVAAAVVAIIARFPTQWSVDNWVENEFRLLGLSPRSDALFDSRHNTA